MRTDVWPLSAVERRSPMAIAIGDHPDTLLVPWSVPCQERSQRRAHQRPTGPARQRPVHGLHRPAGVAVPQRGYGIGVSVSEREKRSAARARGSAQSSPPEVWEKGRGLLKGLPALDPTRSLPCVGNPASLDSCRIDYPRTTRSEIEVRWLADAHSVDFTITSPTALPIRKPA